MYGDKNNNLWLTKLLNVAIFLIYGKKYGMSVTINRNDTIN